MVQVADALERVATLHQEGHISGSEFAVAKQRMLAAPSPSESNSATEACLAQLTGIAKYLVCGLGAPSASRSPGTVYKFDAKDGGWARGTVKSLAKTGPNAGMFGIKFVSEPLIRFLELRDEDYRRHLGQDKESKLSTHRPRARPAAVRARAMAHCNSCFVGSMARRAPRASLQIIFNPGR